MVEIWIGAATLQYYKGEWWSVLGEFSIWIALGSNSDHRDQYFELSDEPHP